MILFPCTVCGGLAAETIIDGIPLCEFHALVEASMRLVTVRHPQPVAVVPAPASYEARGF